MFTTEQPFLDFLCEVMLRSPCGERHYSRRRHMERAESRDILKFLDQNINGVYYDGEIEFLLKHCKSKQQICFSTMTNYFILNQMFLYDRKWEIKLLDIKSMDSVRLQQHKHSFGNKKMLILRWKITIGTTID